MNRLTRIVAAAGAGAGLVLGPVAVAHAAGTAVVSPTTIPPGGKLTVTVTGCNLYNGDGKGAVNIAGPGNSTQPDAIGDMTSAGSGTVTVPSTATAGQWTVWVFCQSGGNATSAFTVAPKGGPPAGDGATAVGPDRTLLLAGTGLLAVAALGAAAVVVTRLRRRHPTG